MVSIKRAGDGRRQKSRRIIDEKREMNRAKNGFLQSTSAHSKEATSVLLKNHASALFKMERLSPTSKAKREAS